MTIQVSYVEAGTYVLQCRGNNYTQDGIKRCYAILTYTLEDTKVEWDRGVDYRMLTCPVCKSRMEV